MNFPFIDAHTHQSKARAGLVNIKSYGYPQTLSHPDTFFHYGSHPWDADEFKADEFQQRLNELIAHPLFVALGECGLDKVRAENWRNQLFSFTTQVRLAKLLSLKVIVLHCVKAFEEVMKIIKCESYEGTLIFHDFNAPLPIAQKLIEAGHYLSLGKTLQRENSKVRQYLNESMLTHLLLETDDESLEIELRYRQLEALLGRNLREQIYLNALRAFGRTNWER